jgi:hypothetical protein
MEQSKWQLILHEDCEYPYYEITNGPVSLIANCGFVGEDDADEENIFRRVFDALDQSGIAFHSGNPLELKQHIEIQKLKYEMEALQAKCERYEAALRDIEQPVAYLIRKADAEGAAIDGHAAMQLSSNVYFLQSIANEALSAGEGGKEVENAAIGLLNLPEDTEPKGMPLPAEEPLKK